jgi:hypothetical protein
MLQAEMLIFILLIKRPCLSEESLRDSYSGGGRRTERGVWGPWDSERRIDERGSGL